MRDWIISEFDKNDVKRLKDEFKLPSFLSMLLCIRGITSYNDVKEFLSNSIELSNPFEIKDMDKAVERINTALENEEFICVYGDYDADGVTATAILYSYLETVGANVMYYIPNREKEGYGLNNHAIKKLAQKGVSLIVTVDNGITYVDCVDYAKSLGIDVVITDHHMPLSELPDAIAVVDPHRADCKSKFKDLSGVGVAFKLITALEGENRDDISLLDNYSDLVSIGTIGDIVSLKGENRLLVKYGLNSLKKTDRASINSLARFSKIDLQNITASSVAFGIVPRINAVGRLRSSAETVDFLLTEDEDLADSTAEELTKTNSERQQIEKQITEDIIKYIQNNESILYDKILVINGEGWHEGVIGISCARIKDLYGKPTIIITSNGDISKGSARSVEGFSIIKAVTACDELLLKYGGHPMAAGMSLYTSNIEEFRKKINEFADIMDVPFLSLNIDCKLNPKILNIEMAKQLSYLEPFGMDNPEPVFGLYKMTLREINPIGGNKHLRLVLERDRIRVFAVKFSCSTDEFIYKVGDTVDVAVTMKTNLYNNVEYLSLIIKDIKFSNIECKRVLEDIRIFEEFMKTGKLKDNNYDYLYPERSDFAAVYRYLKQNKRNLYLIEEIHERIGIKSLNCAKIIVILNAMRELNLIEMTFRGFECIITVNDVKEKVDLEAAEIIKKLSKQKALLK